MDAKEIIRELQAKQGWSDQFMITLLGNFIQTRSMSEDMSGFLGNVAREENTWSEGIHETFQ